MRPICALLVLWFAAGDLPAPAQYPGGGTSGIPWPRGKKKTAGKDPVQPMPTFTGVLKSMDAKALVLTLDDYRDLTFRRTSKTQFLRDSKPVEPATLKPGDNLSVDAIQDIDASLTAVNVRVEKPAPEARTQDEAPAAQPARASPAQIAAEADPDRPKLRRGIPPKRPSTLPEDTEPSAAPVTETPAEVETPEDALVARARAAAETYSEGLPNYFCQQVTSRFISTSRPADWRAQDIVTAEVVYENGREQYRNIKVNGKPGAADMEQLTGSWSKGEFGTTLRDLFSRQTAADFRSRSQATIAGRAAAVYAFEVARENSHWRVQVGGQAFQPAYRGKVWIDKADARVLRIEMQGTHLPEAFPVDSVESATDYEYIRLGDTKKYLLPVHAENLSCQRGSNYCTRNVIDFRNYHHYSGESSIQFEERK